MPVNYRVIAIAQTPAINVMVLSAVLLAVRMGVTVPVFRLVT